MTRLFERASIKTISLENRLVRSATYDGMAEKSGHVSENQIALYQKLAAGGVGLIITGIASVHPSGRISAFQNAIDSDDTIPGLKKLVDAAHAHGSKIALQLFHGGRECSVYQKAKKSMAIAPSVISNDPYCDHEYRAITEDEIATVIQAFGKAAARAMSAGFDAVQIHAAHAYLFSQFLSPATNHRTDSWGGSLENRLSFLHHVYQTIRAEVGTDYPVLIKLGVADGFPGGLAFEEGKKVAVQCAQWGFDAIEISQGLRGKRYSQTEFRTGIRDREEEGYFRTWCRDIKSAVDIPVMMVGGLRSPELMEDMLQNGESDFISLSRPLIREPDIVNRWKNNGFSKPACISCNRCFDNLLKGIPLHCAIED
ncbi:MAG: NADH:flavin oxidoreductase [Desulfatirhabdiaceae bacterium]